MCDKKINVKLEINIKELENIKSKTERLNEIVAEATSLAEEIASTTVKVETKVTSQSQQ